MGRGPVLLVASRLWLLRLVRVRVVLANSARCAETALNCGERSKSDHRSSGAASEGGHDAGAVQLRLRLCVFVSFRPRSTRERADLLRRLGCCSLKEVKGGKFHGVMDAYARRLSEIIKVSQEVTEWYLENLRG